MVGTTWRKAAGIFVHSAMHGNRFFTKQCSRQASCHCLMSMALLHVAVLSSQALTTIADRENQCKHINGIWLLQKCMPDVHAQADLGSAIHEGVYLRLTLRKYCHMPVAA